MGMSLIVKKITQLVIGLIFLFGINIILFGHWSVGGGFAGGVILTCGFILIMLAFGRDIALGKMRTRVAHFLSCGGAIAFLAIALLGYIGGAFFLNFLDPGKAFHLHSAGFIPWADIAISILIVSSIFIVFVLLVLFEHPDENSGENTDDEEYITEHNL
jgi:multisubunit Na+/H+ antiporter MnhB subunit